MKKVFIFLLIIISPIYYFYYEYYSSGKFNTFLDKHPYSELAQYIDFSIGQVNYLRNNYTGAVFRFNRVLKNYFVKKYKLDAYLNLAKTYEKMNNIKEAIEIYQFLKLYYPNTKQGQIATKKLEYLNLYY